MPLTFSIATGLSLGVLSLTFVKLGSGKYREVSPLVWILAILFVLRYAIPGLGIVWITDFSCGMVCSIKAP
jgi:adenine/guanine/hypoxanthine permease